MFRCVAVLLSLVSAYAATVYNPPTAGTALDAIEQALHKIVDNPHLSAAQLKSAKVVSESVEKTVSELESAEGKKLSKEARAAKVTAAINQLQGLQDQWQKAAQQTVADRKAALKKQLEEKEAELAKDEKMLKVVNLEKQLAEKKLALQKLIAMKEAKEAGESAADAEKKAAEQQEMVTNMLNLAKSLSASKAKKTEKKSSEALDKVKSYLTGRMHNVTESLSKLDTAEKKREAELKETLDKRAPVKDGKDAIAKGRSLLNILMKKEHRNFEKTRATLKNELKELTEAEKAIEKGDASGLEKVMGRMQNEMKSLQAKSHKFLY